MIDAGNRARVTSNAADRSRRGPAFMLVILGSSVFAGWGGRRMFAPMETEAIPSRPPVAAASDDPGALSRGAVLFHVHCVKCHGTEGRGDAEAIARLRPPPRDFAERPWRFETTFDSIRRVIVNGIPNTSMAAQRAALKDDELDLLAEHVVDLVAQLPVVRRALSPAQQRLAEVGFEIEREPTPAPMLTVEDARGNSMSTADLKGSWVLLEFWGLSCEPCRKALPALQRLSISAVGESLKIVPVCADADDARTAQDTLSRLAPEMTAYVDATGTGIAQFGVQALPVAWLIDPQGRVQATHVGAIEWDRQAVREAFEIFLLRDVPIKPTWTVTDCAGAPSHALYDPDSGSLFVTQISGVGDEKDGVGTILRLDLDGNVCACQWISGLDAPKGLGRYKTTLWVSDIDRLHAIDIPSGRVVDCEPVPGAKFLTGVAVGGDGTVYVADMLTSMIHRYDNGEHSICAAGDDLESPAGLLLDEKSLVMAAWGLTTDYTTRVKGRLLSMDLRNPKPRAISPRPIGNLYGIASDGREGYFVSAWDTGRILHIVGGVEPRILLQLPQGAAGIAYVPEVKLLVVPELTQNRISAYDLSLLMKP